MVMKGGMLMAIRYNSDRFTKDADFSTREKYLKGSEESLLAELDAQIDLANEQLPYDVMCRRQRSELRPPRGDASFPTLQLAIGYAPRSKERERTRLLNRQAPTVVEIDYSYNEAVFDVEILGLGDGEELQAYSLLNLLAEKLRSLLQQPIRARQRRQDVYDLNFLIRDIKPLDVAEQMQLLNLLIDSCKEREVDAKKDSFANPVVKAMSQHGYDDLAPEIEGDLPPFEEAFAIVQRFYEGLPWEAILRTDSS
jgi:predicted nucleotidyltransferase component of viral defense system